MMIGSSLVGQGHTPAALVPAFGLRKDSPHAPAPEWLTAVGFTMLTSMASRLSQERLRKTCPSFGASGGWVHWVGL